MESRIFWEQDGFSVEIVEFLFAVGASGVDEFRDDPVQVGAGGDEVAIHGPVVVFAEGEAVGRVVVAALGEGDEVGGVDEGDVVAAGEADAQTAGGALVIVEIEDESAEGGAAAVFGRVVGDSYWLRVES